MSFPATKKKEAFKTYFHNILFNLSLDVFPISILHKLIYVDSLEDFIAFLALFFALTELQRRILK